MSKIGQIKTKMIAVMDSLDSIEPKTPNAFNWTPEMQAIWPAEMRPTMSGLLAIWEAMQEAAVYGAVYGELVEDDGWIAHIPGNPNPIPCYKELVEAKWDDGDITSSYYGLTDYSWCKSSVNIIAYRVVK